MTRWIGDHGPSVDGVVHRLPGVGLPARRPADVLEPAKGRSPGAVPPASHSTSTDLVPSPHPCADRSWADTRPRYASWWSRPRITPGWNSRVPVNRRGRRGHQDHCRARGRRPEDSRYDFWLFDDRESGGCTTTRISASTAPNCSMPQRGVPTSALARPRARPARAPCTNTSHPANAQTTRSTRPLEPPAQSPRSASSAPGSGACVSMPADRTEFASTLGTGWRQSKVSKIETVGSANRGRADRMGQSQPGGAGPLVALRREAATEYRTHKERTPGPAARCPPAGPHRASRIVHVPCRIPARADAWAVADRRVHAGDRLRDHTSSKTASTGDLSE